MDNLGGFIIWQYTFKHKLDEYLKNIPDTPKIPGYTYNTNGHKLHHIYAEFPGKLSNTATAESPTWPKILLSNFELEYNRMICILYGFPCEMHCSHHESPNPTRVAYNEGGIRRQVVRNPSHMGNHTKCIFSHTLHFKARLSC